MESKNKPNGHEVQNGRSRTGGQQRHRWNTNFSYEVKKSIWQALKNFNQRFGLQDVLLCLVLMCYAFIGGISFYLLEGDDQADGASSGQEALNVQRHWAMVDMILQLQDNCSSSCSNSYMKIRISAMLKHYEQDMGVGSPAYPFDFWNSVFYASTVFTTIGYGHLTCRTFWGRLTTILYATVGIPLLLTLVNNLGKRLFRLARSFWNRTRRLLRHWYRRLQNLQNRDIKRMISVVSFDAGYAPGEEDVVEVNFPLPLALAIVVLYIFTCAAIFKAWETEWDYFTAFYFFFVSLSTIGFGDVVPNRPRLSLIGFPFFIIGLALVSVCINVIQAKVEKGYLDTLKQLHVGLESFLLGLTFEEDGQSKTSIDNSCVPSLRRLSTVREKPEDETNADEVSGSLGVIQLYKMGTFEPERDRDRKISSRSVTSESLLQKLHRLNSMEIPDTDRIRELASVIRRNSVQVQPFFTLLTDRQTREHKISCSTVTDAFAELERDRELRKASKVSFAGNV